jgi:hypothetical protein
VAKNGGPADAPEIDARFDFFEFRAPAPAPEKRPPAMKIDPNGWRVPFLQPWTEQAIVPQATVTENQR